MPRRIEVIGIQIDKREVVPGVDLADLIVRKAHEQGVEIRDGDILVITSKIVSIAMGRLYRLDEVKPSVAARLIARVTGADPRVVELILREGEPILVIPVRKLDRLAHPYRKYAVSEGAARQAIEQHPVIFMTRVGHLALSDAGLDFSNAPPGCCTLPPKDPDSVARALMMRIRRLTGKRVAVVIADTEALVDRFGSRDIAIGCAGLRPVRREFGAPDLYGKPKFGGVDAVADAVATAAGLVFGQTAESIPVAIVRGVEWEESDEGIRSVCYLSLSPKTRVLAALLIILKTLKVRLLLKIARLFSN